MKGASCFLCVVFARSFRVFVFLFFISLFLSHRSDLESTLHQTGCHCRCIGCKVPNDQG
jgi:hypothetical protein